MAEHVHKVHIDRKELKAPDPFFETAGKLRTAFAENRTTVIVSVAVLVMVLGGSLAANRYRTHSQEQAASSFFRAADAMRNNSFETAKAGFGDVAKNGPDPYSELAILYGADLAVREHRWDDAIELYKGFAGAAETDYLRQIGWKGHGYALEMAGDSATAAKSYHKAADIKGPYTEEALRGWLRAAKRVGDEKGAQEAASRLVKEFPNSEEAEALAERLASNE